LVANSTDCGQEKSVTAVVIPSCNRAEPGKLWTEGETRLLLDSYATNLPEVGPFKRFKNKKFMWEFIASEILKQHQVYVSWSQCEARFKTVKKRQSLSVKHNSTSGNNPVSVEYKEEFERIKAVDDSVQPEVYASVVKIEIVKKKPSKRSADRSKIEDVSSKKSSKEDII